MEEALILDLIKRDGPMPVERFMALALQRYYGKGTAFGRSGDFTTAPEISQVFGELIGAWCCLVWDGMGRPSTFRLVELGPGRGTLMADLLRAARVMPGFLQAAKLHLVEISDSLRRQQAERLAGITPAWHDSLEEVPEDLPQIVVGNEFLDALPIRQYVRQNDEWRERLVGIGQDGGLAFMVADKADGAPPLPAYAETPGDGAIAECCPQAHELVAELARRFRQRPGAALFIDYGPMKSAAGDSLQAVKDHVFCKVLEHPGDADLTAHVDFQALSQSARRRGLAAYGPVPQGIWLQRMGILERTALLKAAALPGQAELLSSGSRRLIEPQEMGTLFKALAMTSAGLPAPMGFEDI